MAFERREYAGAAPQTTLSAPLTNVATAINVVLGTGYPTGAVGKFWIVIDVGTSNEEKILCSARAGTAITAIGRGGVNGDGTTGISHLSGATVNHCFTAYDADEANNHITNVGLDHHTQYLTSTRHDALVHAFGVSGVFGTGATVGTDIAIAGAAGVGTHPAREDHTHKLGAGALNVAAQIAAGTITGTQIAATTIAAANIVAATITAAQIAAATITATQIANATITGTQLAAGAVTAGKVGAGGVSAASQFASGVVDTTALGALAVTTAKIANGAVTGVKMDVVMPQGVLATPTKKTTSQSVTGLTAVAFSMLQTITIAANRYTRFTFHADFAQCSAGTPQFLVVSMMMDGAPGTGTLLGLFFNKDMETTGTRFDIASSIDIVDIASGSHTFEVYLAGGSAAVTGTVSGGVAGSNPGPILLTIEDIGGH